MKTIISWNDWYVIWKPLIPRRSTLQKLALSPFFGQGFQVIMIMGGKFSFLSSTHSQKTVGCQSCRFQSVLKEFIDIRNVYKDNFDFLERSSQKRLQCHNKSFRLLNICRKCPAKVFLIFYRNASENYLKINTTSTSIELILETEPISVW